MNAADNILVKRHPANRCNVIVLSSSIALIVEALLSILAHVVFAPQQCHHGPFRQVLIRAQQGRSSFALVVCAHISRFAAAVLPRSLQARHAWWGAPRRFCLHAQQGCSSFALVVCADISRFAATVLPRSLQARHAWWGAPRRFCFRTQKGFH